MEPRGVRVLLRIWVAVVLLFLFLPLALIILYAFNRSNIQSWPIGHYSLRWFTLAFHDSEVRSAFALTVKAGLLAAGIAILLGSAAAFAIHRFRFFGRESISFLFLLPLALPGVITGIALNSFFSFAHINLGLLTIVIGHATFCIVIVYNNVIARLRRTPTSLVEASMDLGAHGWTAFRTVTLPVIRTSLVAGALLAFALSFDEVLVTVFTAGARNTLPLWILGTLRLGQNLPEVNVVVFGVILITTIPVALAARLTGGAGVARGSTAQTMFTAGVAAAQGAEGGG